jgi:hypothetical protein
MPREEGVGSAGALFYSAPSTGMSFSIPPLLACRPSTSTFSIMASVRSKSSASFIHFSTDNSPGGTGVE